MQLLKNFLETFIKQPVLAQGISQRPVALRNQLQSHSSSGSHPADAIRECPAERQRKQLELQTAYIGSVFTA